MKWLSLVFLSLTSLGFASQKNQLFLQASDDARFQRRAATLAKVGVTVHRAVPAGLKLTSFINAGGFGCVWKGSFNGKPVAIKLAQKQNTAMGGIFNKAKNWINEINEADGSAAHEIAMMEAVKDCPNFIRFLNTFDSKPKDLPANVVQQCKFDKKGHEVVGMVTSLFESNFEESKLELHGMYKENPAAFFAIFKNVAEALQCMTKLNLVHRDLKPANLMLDTQGHGVVVDMGLADTFENAIKQADSYDHLGSTGWTPSKKYASNDDYVKIWDANALALILSWIINPGNSKVLPADSPAALVKLITLLQSKPSPHKWTRVVAMFDDAIHNPIPDYAAKKKKKGFFDG